MAQFNVGNLLETARPVWAIDGEGNILGLVATPMQVAGTVVATDGGGSLTVDGTVSVAGASAVVLDDGLAAARAGNGVCRWANEIVPDAAEVVITTAMAPLLTYNIPAGKRVMVTQYCYAVETTGDDCQFEFGATDGADGAGTFYPLGPHKHVYTGAANQGRTAFDQDITPPEPISYAAGFRCITFRVDANDAACKITVGWHGWVEDE